MNSIAAINFLDHEETRRLFAELYGPGPEIFLEQKKRYAGLIEQFKKRFGDRDIHIFSSPGRSEISGNHTDHNHGKVLAASIQLDCIAVVSASDDSRIYISDNTYQEDYEIDTNKTLPLNNERGSPALIRGIIEGFKKAGFSAGGFYDGLMGYWK